MSKRTSAKKLSHVAKGGAKGANKQYDLLHQDLLTWYDDHARVLPWRLGPAERKAGMLPDPYHVWLSEIMLQQTTVVTVTPRFQEFLARWPDVKALAASPVEDVLGAWAGLGYYARARNLHKCAVIVSENYDGYFPDTEEELRTLPGIGEYTAAAIAAIAFNKRAIVMDGNIERVTARIFAEVTPLPSAKPVLKEQTESYWPLEGPSGRHGDFAQSLMDLGAGICKPKKPLCLLCPIRSYCQANKDGQEEKFPVKAPKKKKPTRYGSAFVIRKEDGTVAFERRPDKGLLGGMLGLPGSLWEEGQEPELSANELTHTAPITGKWGYAGQVRHTFTHFHLVLGVYVLSVGPKQKTRDQYLWHSADTVRLPTVMKKALRLGVS